MTFRLTEDNNITGYFKVTSETWTNFLYNLIDDLHKDEFLSLLTFFAPILLHLPMMIHVMFDFYPLNSVNKKWSYK